ncbi:hypothetical protein FA15DRAFT_715211 [Coprinopsis marcescibilis]|uniref:Uncharacterized protein n=1 Tax=Coprinopsis marcescibilis TaxID=230819 RepID=A0A5C3KP95_COPMA|nr:hypothetical protein FA15DRAFT_715211 [Coprinopsis marcescibilis]
MPSYTAIFEDTAPFLTYTGEWVAGRSLSDDFTQLYSQSSFMVTNRQDCAFSFEFYGSGFGIYGAKRGNHGLFQVTVDGTEFPPESGLPSGPDQFNATLFSLSLPRGFHTVQLRNSENTYRDIDYVSWEANIGLDDEPLIVNTVQDSHPAWVYDPPDAWTDRPVLAGTFSGATGHATTVDGASASLSFQVRDAIAVYGPAGPNCTFSYTVSVDGQAINRTFSALKDFYRPQQLLYYVGNLGPGNHVISFMQVLQGIQAGRSGQQHTLAIDYAEIYTTPSLGGRFVSNSSVTAQILTSKPIAISFSSVEGSGIR